MKLNPQIKGETVSDKAGATELKKPVMPKDTK